MLLCELAILGRSVLPVRGIGRLQVSWARHGSFLFFLLVTRNQGPWNNGGRDRKARVVE